MSFIASDNGRGFEAGYFLQADEACVRVTKTVSAEHAQAVTLGDGRKVVPAGAIWPSNDGEAEGILYEEIDVSNGDAPGSVVIAGRVYADRLPAAAESAAVSAMSDIKFVTSAPRMVRPLFEATSLGALTVQSAAGTASGDTKLTVSGYSLGTGDGYVLKVGDEAQAVAVGDDLSGWTSWNGSADVTAASDKVVTVAVVDADGFALAAGSATVVAQA